MSEPFDVCWERIARAGTHRQAIARIWNDYIETEAYASHVFVRPDDTGSITTTRRRLVSKFLLVRPAGTVFWVPFRDIVEVDGRALTDRPDRLMRLFVESGASGTAQAVRIAAAGARLTNSVRVPAPPPTR